jgi:murein DD-endopeptidase MepM/ murein hydrolase activator NlpD
MDRSATVPERRAAALTLGLALCLLAACAQRDGGPAPVAGGRAAQASRPGAAQQPARQVAAPQSPGIAIVQSGDTLYAIARRTNVPVRGLIDANGLRPPYTVVAGQRLRLPAAAPEHAVAAAPGAEAARDRTAGQAAQPAAPASVASPAAAPLPAAAPASAPQPDPAPPPRSGRFAWPVRGTIMSAFGAKPGGLQNDGINIAAPRGTPVRAAEHGVVVYAGNELKGFGNLLLLRHADGWMSAYAHLDEAAVARGAQVQRGQVIGQVGQTGGVASPQLHFELRRGGRAVDPQSVLSATQAGS